MSVFRFLLMLLNESICICIIQSGETLWSGDDKVEALEWLVKTGRDTKKVLCWRVVTVKHIGNDDIDNVCVRIYICE